MIFLKPFLIFVLLTTIFGCKDDERTIDIKKLTQYDWHLRQMHLKITNPITPEYNTDTLFFPEKCDSGDYRHFYADSTYIDYNTGKCDLSEKGSYTGSWSYSKQGPRIILTDENLEKQEFTLYELNDNWLILIQENKSVVIKNKKEYTLYSRKKFYYRGEKPL